MPDIEHPQNDRAALSNIESSAEPSKPRTLPEKVIAALSVYAERLDAELKMGALDCLPGVVLDRRSSDAVLAERLRNRRKAWFELFGLEPPTLVNDEHVDSIDDAARALLQKLVDGKTPDEDKHDLNKLCSRIMAWSDAQGEMRLDDLFSNSDWSEKTLREIRLIEGLQDAGASVESIFKATNLDEASQERDEKLCEPTDLQPRAKVARPLHDID